LMRSEENVAALLIGNFTPQNPRRIPQNSHRGC
jgi:hypothetical protein